MGASNGPVMPSVGAKAAVVCVRRLLFHYHHILPAVGVGAAGFAPAHHGWAVGIPHDATEFVAFAAALCD